MARDDELYFIEDGEDLGLNEVKPENQQGLPKHGPSPADAHLRCLECDYDLTGLINRVCPECGEAFDVAETARTNTRESWEYLLENRCTPVGYPFFMLAKSLGISPRGMNKLLWLSDYLHKGALAAMACTFVTLSMYQPRVLLALFIVMPSELFIIMTGRGGVWLRFFIWVACTLGALVMVIL